MSHKKKSTCKKSVFKQNTLSSVNQAESCTSTKQHQGTSIDTQEDNTSGHQELCVPGNKQETERDNSTALDSGNKPRDTNSTTTKQRSYQPFTVVCAKELVRKVKAIARKEGLHVNAVVQAMYEEGIRRYEERHGALDAEPMKKNAREILFAT